MSATRYRAVKNSVYLDIDCEQYVGKEFHGDLVLDKRKFIDETDYEAVKKQRDKLLEILKDINQDFELNLGDLIAECEGKR